MNDSSSHDLPFVLYKPTYFKISAVIIYEREKTVQDKARLYVKSLATLWEDFAKYHPPDQHQSARQSVIHIVPIDQISFKILIPYKCRTSLFLGECYHCVSIFAVYIFFHYIMTYSKKQYVICSMWLTVLYSYQSPVPYFLVCFSFY